MKTKTIFTGVIGWLFVLLPVLAMGQQKAISDFKLTDARTNEQVMLSTFKDKVGVVLVFTSNYCPYSKLYENRIAALASTYPDVQVILINSNDPVRSKDDSMEEMAKKATSSNYTYPYLADKGQVVSNLLGATKTPEAFLLRYTNNMFQVQYYGAIDDNPQNENDVQAHFLKNAIDALKGATPQPKPYVRPTGCMIKKG